MVDDTNIGDDGARTDANTIEQMRHFRQMLPLYGAAQIALGSLIAAGFFESANLAVVVIWIGLIWVTGLIAIRDWWRHRGLPTQTKISQPTVKRAELSAVMMGTIWGGGAIVLFPDDSLGGQTLLTFVIAGATAGATASSWNYPKISLGFCLPALALLSLRLVYAGETIHFTMAAMTAVYFAFLMALSRFLHRGFLEGQAVKSHLSYIVESLNQMKAGIAIYDENEKLVFINNTHRELFPETAEAEVRGVRLEDTVRLRAESGVYPDIAGREAEWTADILSQIRTGEYDSDRKHSDGRWIQTSVRRAENGIHTEIRTDVTHLKEIEEELEKSTRRLALTLGYMPGGILQTDADMRVVFTNEGYRELLDLPANKLRHGTHISDLFRILAERGDLGEGEVDEIVARETAEYEKRLEITFERHFNDGTIAQVRRTRTDDGGLLTTVEDITDRWRAEETLRESEARFRAVIDGTPDVVVLKDLEGRILMANKTFQDQLGLPFSEIGGRTLYEIPGVPKELADAYSEHEKNAIEAGKAVSTELGGFMDDGRKRVLLSTKFPIFNQHGEVVSVGSINREISELKLVEAELAVQKKALEFSEERFRDFTESASDWYWEMGKDLRFTYFSEGIRGRQSGVDTQTALGKTRQETLAGSILDEDQLRTNLEDLEAHRPFRNFEYSLVGEDGEMSHVAISGKPVFGPNGNFRGYRGVGRDVTERVEAQNKISEQRDELEILNHQKSRFFSILAHDLKNPFNILLGYSQLIDSMGDTLDRDELIKMAGSISATSNNLYQLLEDLLAWGLAQMDAIEFEPKPEALGNLIDIGIENQLGVAESKGVELRQKATELNVVADSNLVGAIIRNLVSNAIKFTPPGGEVTLDASKLNGSDEDWVGVSVSDNGVGMNQSQIDQLFRIDANQSTRGTDGESGTGLGLLLCKEFVEKHGGEISVESEEGAGTTFRFTLPGG